MSPFEEVLEVSRLTRVSIGKRENEKRSVTANLCTNLMQFVEALVNATLHINVHQIYAYLYFYSSQLDL